MAAEDRRRASADREHAAQERAETSQEREEDAQELELAATDPLTGARTRRFGLQEVEREIERAHRTGASLVLGFIDVDNLKAVNDAEGHLAGDAFLQKVGATLRANLRSYDVIVRFGGDEFICAMPNLTVAAARKRLEQIAPVVSEDTPLRCSISFGLAELVPADDLSELVARADKALLARRRRIREAPKARRRD